eukprot:gene11411-4578_t
MPLKTVETSVGTGRFGSTACIYSNIDRVQESANEQEEQTSNNEQENQQLEPEQQQVETLNDQENFILTPEKIEQEEVKNIGKQKLIWDIFLVLLTTIITIVLLVPGTGLIIAAICIVKKKLILSVIFFITGILLFLFAISTIGLEMNIFIFTWQEEKESNLN